MSKSNSKSTSSTISSPRTISSNQNSHAVNLYLSRSTYALGSSVVGTITVANNNRNNNENNNKNYYSSIQVYVAGRCRIDSRWHKSDTQESILKLYGNYGHPCHGQFPSFIEETVVDSYFKKGGASVASTGGNAGSAIDQLQGGDSKHSSRTASVPVSTQVTTKRKLKHQTFCYWSTNVLTLWKYEDGTNTDEDREGDNLIPNMDKNIQVPIYNDISNNQECHAYQTLIMNDSKWYNEGTRIVEDLEDCDDYLHLAYDNDNEQEERGQQGNSSEDNEDENNQEEQEVTSSSSNNDIDGIQRTNGYANGTVPRHYERENQEAEKDNSSSNGASTSTTSSSTMNFTLKVDLPDDLPPTANTASARYFYSAVVIAQSADGHFHIYQAPFTVVQTKEMMLDQIQQSQPSSSLQQEQPQQTKIRIGTIYAVAHPMPNPISLSSTYAAEPWRTSVQRVNGGWDHSNVRSIMMEQNGYKCAILTIVGGVVMVPGEKVMLHFEFLHHDEYNEGEYCEDDDDDGSSTCIVTQKEKYAPCHMVSACLQGEEYALGLNGSKSRSRSYMFDTTYAHVDPDCTKSISLNLSLPLDCPISLSTDFVTTDLSCRVDLTVSMPNNSGSTTGGTNSTSGESFKFLTVQFPCHVVSSLAASTQQHDLNDESRLSKEVITKIMENRRSNRSIESCDKVICPEILDDLSMLSMHVLHRNKAMTA